MAFRIAVWGMIVVFSTCGWAQVRPGARVNMEVPFHRGVNLTGWFQAESPRRIQFSKFTKQDFLDIQSLGCDVIRLPINLHFMTGGAPDYRLDPLFLQFLDQVVDWCQELDLHLILDNHTFDVTTGTDVNVDQVLVPIWTQMAEHYKNSPAHLYYEVLNEPHGIPDARWGQIQYRVIMAIHAVDPVHPIIVTGAGWGSYNNLNSIPSYPRDYNLIYSFHFYDPFLFTHQGASWTDPSMVSLAGIPFPYDAGPVPACPPQLKGTWIENSLNSYQNDGTVAHVRQLLDIAVSFRDKRQVPVFCGEFGVYKPNSDSIQRVYWYQIVREYLEEKGIAWTCWDYHGGFGLFEFGSNEMFEHDLNVPLVGALGLTAPEQSPFVMKPESKGFDIYTDYLGPNIQEASYSSHGIIDFYWDTAPAAGQYCIYCTGCNRYASIGFDFRPDKDLTELVTDGYQLEFWVRGDTPGTRFDVRFLDTKTVEPQDHPWRMTITIDEKMVAWDGLWHRVQIPLRSLKESGAWDNGAWFNPKGAFDWSAVDRFEIVAEHHSFADVQFWFDDLRITPSAPPR
ncbi:MAG TPA: glycoside hydrolase family 5 protein [Sedimentisphaerales bacterium]|nr:glycoside hydrolase family 5 protein [Sedimentisphaerales bacterium]